MTSGAGHGVAGALFAESGWRQVFDAQGVTPEPSASAAACDAGEVAASLEGVRGTIGHCMRAMPMHGGVLNRPP